MPLCQGLFRQPVSQPSLKIGLILSRSHAQEYSFTSTGNPPAPSPKKYLPCAAPDHLCSPFTAPIPSTRFPELIRRKPRPSGRRFSSILFSLFVSLFPLLLRRRRRFGRFRLFIRIFIVGAICRQISRMLFMLRKHLRCF